jgi:hypothetical protein
LRQVDGSVVSLTAKGFDHFKRSEQHG